MEWIRIITILICASAICYGCQYLNYRVLVSDLGKNWFVKNFAHLALIISSLGIVPFGAWFLIGSNDQLIKTLVFLPVVIGFLAVFTFNKELVQRAGKIQNPNPKPSTKMFSGNTLLFLIVITAAVLFGYKYWLFPTLSDYTERVDSYSIITSELVTADSGVLYSLEPEVRGESDGYFRGVKILGKIDLAGNDLKFAMDEFTQAIDSFKGRRGAGPECFKPRVALRLIKRGKIQDFLLCYECHSIQMHREGHQILEGSVAGSQDKINDFFVSSGIPFSKKAE